MSVMEPTTSPCLRLISLFKVSNKQLFNEMALSVCVLHRPTKSIQRHNTLEYGKRRSGAIPGYLGANNGSQNVKGCSHQAEISSFMGYIITYAGYKSPCMTLGYNIVGRLSGTTKMALRVTIPVR